MGNILIIGATSAISQAVAEVYAEQGEKLFLVARNKELLAKLSQHLLVLGAANVNYTSLDITELDLHQSILDEAISSCSHLDVIFIAPGILSTDEGIEQQLAAFHVNATCTIAFAERSAKALSLQGHGALAVLSSVAGDRGRQSNYWYGAAKGAVSIFL